MPDSADLDITTTVDLRLIDRMLSDAEARVLESEALKTVKAIRTGWDGWAYKGRPMDAPRGVSQVAWKRLKTQTTEGVRFVEIVNRARDYRDGTSPYVAHVHRSGTRKPEWLNVWADIQNIHVPRLRKALIEAVADNLEAPGRKRKVRRNKQDTNDTLNVMG